MSDEEVIERLRERFSENVCEPSRHRRVEGWALSSARRKLIGDLDKITGSAERRSTALCSGSNFMMYAGLDKDGHSRFKKYVDGFAKELRKARETNDETLAEWERQAAWKAAEIERGRAFFKMILDRMIRDRWRIRSELSGRRKQRGRSSAIVWRADDVACG